MLALRHIATPRSTLLVVPVAAKNGHVHCPTGVGYTIPQKLTLQYYPRDWLGKVSPKWPICVNWDVKLYSAPKCQRIWSSLGPPTSQMAPWTAQPFLQLSQSLSAHTNRDTHICSNRLHVQTAMLCMQCSLIHIHTHTQTFNGLFFRTTWVGRYEKDKPFWILLKQETMGWQWHQLNHM